MSDAPADETALKLELLKMDVQLRRKQVFWETPKGVLLVAATAVAIAGTVFGALGYRIGSQQSAPQPIVIQLQQPAAPTR